MQVTIDLGRDAGDGSFRVSFVVEGDVSQVIDRLGDFGVGSRISEHHASDIIVTSLYGRVEQGVKPFQLSGDNNSFDFDAQVRAGSDISSENVWLNWLIINNSLKYSSPFS